MSWWTEKSSAPNPICTRRWFCNLALPDINVITIETGSLADFTISSFVVPSPNHASKVTVRAGEC